MGDKIKNLINIWKDFAKRNKKFNLNSDNETVERLAKGVLENEKNHGLKYCPCRLSTGDKEEDLKLICPCNFFTQQTWQERGECWCSLFVKDNK